MSRPTQKLAEGRSIDEFLAASPDNPVALALSAIHASGTNDLESAIEDLQQSLEQYDGITLKVSGRVDTEINRLEQQWQQIEYQAFLQDFYLEHPITVTHYRLE